MKTWLSVGLAMAGLIGALDALAQEKHALLVGINYGHLPETKVLPDGRVVSGGRLFGPLNLDVPRVERLLKERYQFPVANLKILKEREATKQGILDALETHLVQRVKPGDFAFFYFSGHGSRAPSGKLGEPFDELICPVDYGAANGLAINAVTDKLLKDIMDRLAAKTGRENVLVILDSCHSGTATRSLFEGGGGSVQPADSTAVPKYFPATSYWEMNDSRAISGTRGANEKFAFGGSSEDTMKHLLLAACDRNETGKDNNREGGFFTSSLCRTLEANPTASYQDVMNAVESQVRDLIVRAKTTSQTPQLEGPPELKRRPVFTPFKAAPAIVPPPPPPPPAPVVPSVVNHQIVAAVGGHPVVPVIPMDGLQQLGSITLSVALDKAEYREGDELKITVTADKDCYLRIYNINPQGRAVQLFPNAFQLNNQVRAGQTVLLPGGNATFALPVSGDTRAEFGNEIINVLAAEKQWLDLAQATPRSYTRGLGEKFLDVTTQGPGQTRRSLTLAETFVEGAHTRSVSVVGRTPVQVFDISARMVGFSTRPLPGKK